MRELETRLNKQLFLYFKYIFVKLFDFKAIDNYNIENPVVKVLLPKMNYEPSERKEVIRRAYSGLYQLAPQMLFDKYIDFIDVYAEISEKEREDLYHEIAEHKETAMLAQYIKEKGLQEGMQKGMQQGMQQGMQKGIQQGEYNKLKDVVVKMYHKGMPTDDIAEILEIDKEKILVLIKEVKTN